MHVLVDSDGIARISVCCQRVPVFGRRPVCSSILPLWWRSWLSWPVRWTRM